MNKYELLYVVSTKLEDEKREELITRFANLVTEKGGEVEVLKWGIKKLAYPIKFQSEGFYVQMNFSAPEDLPLEIERQLRLLDYILRFMTIKKIENKLTAKAAAKKEAIKRAKDAAAAEAAAAEAAAKKEAAKAEKAAKAGKAEKTDEAPAECDSDGFAQALAEVADEQLEEALAETVDKAAE